MCAVQYTAPQGRDDGPRRYRGTSDVLDVGTGRDPLAPPAGEARPVGWRQDDGGPVALFRLRIRGTLIPGLWECVGGRFLPADAEDARAPEAAEGPRGPSEGCR